MAAGVGRAQPKRRVGLLRPLHVVDARAPVRAERAADVVGVEHELGVGEAARDPARAEHRRLFVAGQHQHDVPARREALALEPHQRGDELHDADLVVRHATREQIAALFD